MKARDGESGEEQGIVENRSRKEVERRERRKGEEKRENLKNGRGGLRKMIAPVLSNRLCHPSLPVEERESSLTLPLIS